jgi:hypothetical protein
MKRTSTIQYYHFSREKSPQVKNQGKEKEHMVSPSESVIRNILNYSKTLTVIKTKETGILNLVMN